MLHVFKITDLCMVTYRKSCKSGHLTTVWVMTPVAVIVTVNVYTASTCQCFFTLVLNSAYFWYKKFAHYLNLLCWHQLNKIFYWFSQRVWCQGCNVRQFYQ
jgi:hypothetical protein